MESDRRRGSDDPRTSDDRRRTGDEHDISGNEDDRATGATDAAETMIGKHADGNYVGVIEGIRMKTLVWGKNSLMSEFLLDAGSVLPEHNHPHEQTGYLVFGRMEIRVGGVVYELTTGDSWCIPGGVPHGARIIDDSIALEVFSPLRDEYIKYSDPGSITGGSRE
jgi:quercetin dioxygenase-like cupin family protein